MRQTITIFCIAALSALTVLSTSRAAHAQNITLDYHDYAACNDARLRSLSKYDKCSSGEITRMCEAVRTMSTPPSGCAKNALRLWRSCTSARLSPTQRSACQAARFDGTKSVATGTDRISLLTSTGRAQGFFGSASGTGLPWASIATNFFVARAKAELVLFLRDRMKGAMCGESTIGKVAGDLLKETCGALHAAGAGSADQIALLPSAFRNDITALPERLPKLVFRLAKAELLRHPKAKQLVCVAEAFATGYTELRNQGPIQALNAIATATPTRECTTIVKPVRHAAEVAHRFLSRAGAVLSQARRGSFDVKALLADIKSTLTDPKYRQALMWIERNLILMERLVGLLRKLDDATKHDPDLIDKIVESSIELFASASGELADTSTLTDLQTFASALSAFATRRYAAGVLRLLAVQTLSDWASQDKTFKKWWSALGKYGPLVASLSTAKTAEDAEKILQAAAAPLASWREFRREKWAGFISAQFGFGGGYEFALGGSNGGLLTPALPIGLEFGRPLGESCSFNVFISLFDVGALAATRLDEGSTSGDQGMDDEVEKTPTDDLASIFAPGMFLSLGLGNSPFVLSAGAQYLPANRRVFNCTGSTKCADSETKPVVRAMVYLGIDLPAFPLFK